MALVRRAGYPPVAVLNLGEHYRWCSSSLKFGSHTRQFTSVQSFREPYWLAPNEDESFCILEDGNTSRYTSEGTTLYVVQLVTSTSRNSGFSDSDARLRFSLIGENGVAIMKQVMTNQDENSKFRKFHLQSGDIDTFKFSGPDIGRLTAMWIAPQTGTWRLDEARVTVISNEKCEQDGYVFKGTGELLGDGGDILAVELRPLMESPSDTVAANAENETRKQGMREYESLKSTSLVLDVLLVIFGTGVLMVTGFSDGATGFSVGGAAGFLYLILLEKAVDQINPQTGDGENGTGSNGLIVRIAFVLGFVFIVGKAIQNVSGDFSWSLSSGQLLAGAAGFFMFRIAVLLAAVFKSDI